VKLFRRKTQAAHMAAVGLLPAADHQLIEAWRRGQLKVVDPTLEQQAKLVAALDESSAVVEPTPPAPAVEVARRGAQPAQEERPAGFPPDECRCGGHVGWIDRGDHWDGSCHGPCKMPHFRNKWRPRSFTDIAETIDLVQQENEALHRENKRLRSELNQAIAQRDIATEVHAADIEAARIAAAGLEAFRIEGSSYPPHERNQENPL